MTNVPLDGSYREGLEVIRKTYRARMRNRGGKVYLTLYWDYGTFADYQIARQLVEQIWPDAYVTSASTMSDATFRLNPPDGHWSKR